MKKRFGLMCRLPVRLVLWVCFLVSVGSASAALVGHWPLEEGAGSTTASAVQSPNHDGTLNGAVWITENLPPVPSGSAAAVAFDASLGHTVSTGYEGITGTGARTVAAWVRADPIPLEYSAIAAWGVSQSGARITFRLNTALADGVVGALRFEVQNGFVTAQTPLTDGLWHHVAMVLDANAAVKDVRLFVDGIWESTFSGQSSGNPSVNTLSSLSTPVTLGGRPDNNAYNFAGSIDEVRIYDEALSDSEVLALATPAPDLILSFTASPNPVDPGQNTTLSWTVTQFDTITIDQDIGDVSAHTTGGTGSITVSPAQSTLYTLTVQSGTVTDTRSVAVFLNTPADVRINEVMTDNQNTLNDEEGDDEDWIELKNFGGNSQNLAGWHLTDNSSDLDKWTFPDAVLGPGEFLLVFASGKDRRVPEEPLHTNFRLEKEGEYLALIRPDGVTVVSEFSPTIPPLITDLSFGLAPNGTDRVFFFTPTPNAENNEGTPDLGPSVADVTDAAPRPNRTAGNGPLQDQLVVTARVQATQDPITDVRLFYRVMFEPESELPMADDGLPPDATLGDGLFTAAIPLDGLQEGQMIRWRVAATDLDGTVSRQPPYYDPLWTTDDTSASPEYFGTVAQIPSVQTSLPLLEWFVADPAAARTLAGTRGAVFYLGEFYDNIYTRVRGGTTANLAKNSYKLDFNKGFGFRFRPDQKRVTEVNLNTTYTDKTYVRQNLAFEVYDAAGAPGCVAFPVRVDQNGAFFSVASFIEQPDEDLLDREGLDPNGALYKMFNAFTSGSSGVEKKTRRYENNSDLITFVNNINSLTGQALDQYLFDQVNVPRMMNYQAATVLSQNNDCMAKNYFVYRDSDGSGEWFPLPWDVDLTFGRHYMTDDNILGDLIWADEDYVLGGSGRNVPIAPSHPFVGTQELPGNRSWNRLTDAVFRSAKFTELYRRRLRTLMDQILQPPQTAPERRALETRLDALAAQIGNDAVLDQNKWGQFGTPQTLAQAIEVLKSQYLDLRRPHLFLTHLADRAGQYPEPNSFSTLLPGPQPPGVVIQFGAIEVTPSSGNQGEEYVELVNPNPIAIDLSGWNIEGGIRFTLPPGTVIPSNDVLYLSPDPAAFRARTSGPGGGQGLLVVGNYQGQLSARGESLVLTDTFGRPVDATSYPGAPSPAQQFLRITEIMYNPAPRPGETNSPQDFEFIELKNVGVASLDLDGVRFASGIYFDFSTSSVTTLAPGQFLLLARSPAAVRSRYGIDLPLAGAYSGSLDNAGERIRLVDDVGEEILDFHYEDDWHPVTDGLGFSLVVVNEQAEPDAWSDPANWRASGQLHGSPGLPDPAPPAWIPVLVNEALTRTDVPPPTDSIELFNPTGSDANISGWFLTDDFNTPKKFRIPDGTTLASGAYAVFTETDFNTGQSNSFSLRSTGDELYLFSGDTGTNLTGYVHGFEYGAAEDGVSFGRHLTHTGEEQFVPQAGRTLGSTNAGPKIGPLVISEIMYHPPDAGGTNNTLQEFVELFNISGSPVTLFDPDYPDNTWQVGGGIDFTFPPGQSVATDEHILLVNFNPATETSLADAFRATYGLTPATRLFGPYRGNLDNQGEQIRLSKPTTPGTNGVPYVLVEAVAYRDRLPWPTGADGAGLSLQRTEVASFGNDPAHWIAAPPSAGATTGGGIPPVITSQPQNQTVLASTPAEMRVAATGTEPLRFQWRFRDLNLLDATNPVLVLPSVQAEQYGSYQAVVFNAAGSAVSSNAILNVVFLASITRQPQSVTVMPGTNVTFTVAALSSTPITYQWRLNGSDIAGATNAAYTLDPVRPDSQGTYDVVVTDATGSVTSDPAFLTVLVPPTVVRPLQPLQLSVVQGQDVTLSVSVVDTATLPVYYRWRRGFINLTYPAVLALDSPTSFITLTNVQPSSLNTVSVIISNAAFIPTTSDLHTNAVLQVLADTDGDRLPDAWETENGLDPNNPSDAGLDSDQDGLTHGEEYLAGTDPNDSSSYLRVNRITADGTVSIEFLAASNKTYTVQYADFLGSGVWHKLTDVVAKPQTGPEIVRDATPLNPRYYRLVTPRQP